MYSNFRGLLGVRFRLKNDCLEFYEDRFSALDRKMIQYRPGPRVQFDRVYFLHWYSLTLPIVYPLNPLAVAISAFTN